MCWSRFSIYLMLLYIESIDGQFPIQTATHSLFPSIFPMILGSYHFELPTIFGMISLLGPMKGGHSVECQGQIFGNVACQLENGSVECRLNIL